MELKAYAAETSQGPHLQVNEDAHEIDLLNKLFMVFDGFGGSGIGDRVVNQLKGTIKHFFSRIGGDPDATLPFYYSQKYILEGNALLNAIQYAHKALSKENKDLPLDQRGGASGVFTCLAENMATIVSVGNCACFLFRKGHLYKLIQEDSMRYLGSDDLSGHFRTCPLSAFGLFEDLHYRATEVRVLEGDIIAMVSDGIYARLDEEEIKYILGHSRKNLSEKIKSSFQLSNERGNLDNQTGLLLQF